MIVLLLIPPRKLLQLLRIFSGKIFQVTQQCLKKAPLQSCQTTQGFLSQTTTPWNNSSQRSISLLLLGTSIQTLISYKNPDSNHVRQLLLLTVFGQEPQTFSVKHSIILTAFSVRFWDMHMHLIEFLPSIIFLKALQNNTTMQ